MKSPFLPFLSFVTAALFTAAPNRAAAAVPTVDPRQAAAWVAQGEAVLIDIREPDEWEETGVAAPAVLLAKSDFDGRRQHWGPFLQSADKKRTLVLYCYSGGRSEVVARALAREGYRVANAGGFSDWQKAGLPVKPVKDRKQE